ncbi:hypothetical protein CIPAW_09G135300 [Carya illinoinensis]|uniref:Uncharacterized protein n=1 Tax=Carya illinoinensis TaxID=32201 RepID=A0A8T1PLD8_CARIL|nr:hypothetical protein CIPAW_09G135300 [Carya illinoinensis]
MRINPLATVNPRFPYASKAKYFLKAWFQTLFYIEKSVKTDPFQIASDYFPRGFHWIPEDLNKNLTYYLGILVGTGSVSIKPIYFITEEEWETHPSTFKTISDSNTQYNYYDYIEAWLKFPLLQNPVMQHSWFFNFDKKCKQSFPLWFQKWWHFFGPINDFFPDSLQQAIKHFTISSVSKMKGRDILLSPLLHFCAKYKIPWICRWQYAKKDHILIRQYFVKWWDKFLHTNDIISRISVDFPLVVPNLKDKQEFPSPTPIQALITYPTIPGSSDQASGTGSKSSSSKQKKKSSSAKKNNSTDSSSSPKMKKQDLLLQIQLLKKSIEGTSNSEDSDKESEALSTDSAASAPCSNTFGHDSEDYPPRLGDN